MLNFFRKIRIKQFSENHISRFLLYALGEILLVVIGILIALSLDAWKDTLAEHKLERSLYNDLIEELKIDLSEIQDSKAYNQKYLSRYKLASNIIMTDSKRIHVDTLALISTELTKFSDFRNVGSAYEKLTISGKLNLISNDEILNALQNLGILYTYINRIEKNQEDYMFTIVPKITQFIKLKPLEVVHVEELYNYKFHNVFELIISIGTEKEGLYEEAERDIARLISMLKKNLKES